MSQSSDFPFEERSPAPDAAHDTAAVTHTPLQPPQQRGNPDASPARIHTQPALDAAAAASQVSAAPVVSSVDSRRSALSDRSDGVKRIRSDSAARADEIASVAPDQHGVSSMRAADQSAPTSNSPAPQSAPQGSRDMHDNGRSAVTTAPADDSPGSAAAVELERSPEHGGANDRDSNAQKRRLNQACLLCRRKKIRCDSVHPSCSNCRRRGIQCIYPEVRKRGRPPRMYTFADFALPGQPLPPELQGLANVHASAMLTSSGAQAQQPRHPATANPTHGWSTSASAVASSFGHSVTGDMNGGSTPGYAQSDYDRSPALPPISVAVGRGGAPHSGHHTLLRSPADPMLVPTPPLGVDQAVLHLFEFVAPSFPIIHRHTLVRNIHDRSLSLPLWLAIHAVSARFEPHHDGRLSAHHRHGQPHPQQPGSAPSGYRLSSAVLGAGYAEKAHAMLVNRVGHRQARQAWSRSERGRVAAARDSMHELGGVDRDLPRREVIELLQSLILLSIYYAGNWELELAVETHAAAVRIAQRMGVHLIDDPAKLQDASGIFNPAVAQHQRKRAQSRVSSTSVPAHSEPHDIDIEDGRRLSSAAAQSADLRSEWIECETLRRLWWSMFILDRMYCMCAGCPRMVHVSSFRVRLPCSDLEWDSMRAQPTAASPTATAAMAGGGQRSGLMVRTFREAVMHTSTSEQAANEIAATPSADPDVFRYFAALAGIVDSVMDFGDDIRALATPPILDGTEILNQLKAEQAASGHSRPGYSRYDTTLHNSLSANGADAKPFATATWLGLREASSQFARTGRGGWTAPAVNAAWPPDWRARMRVLKERAAALERQFADWYSSMPIAQVARKPYLYSQLPLQDRVSYFHQQLAYYGGVIQLQSLVVMAQGLLLPDAVDDESGVLGQATHGFGPSALTSMLWRLLTDTDAGADVRSSRGGGSGGEGGELGYTPRRRQFGMQPGWGARRGYSAGMDDAYRDGLGEEDQPPPILDESGNSPEIIREELQRIVHAAWRRCTDAAVAMSSAVRRATEVRRVASANPNAPYYDPTFRLQVLPPYRGDGARDRSSPKAYPESHVGLGIAPQFDRAPATSEIRSSPHRQHHAGAPKPAYPELVAQHAPLDQREPAPTAYSQYHQLPPLSAPLQQQQQQQQQADSPAVPGFDGFADSAPGISQALDDASLPMRFNMFPCLAVYTAACIHLHNLRLTPRWEEAARSHHEAAVKANEARVLQSNGTGRMPGPDDGVEPGLGMLPNPQDVGVLPPPPPPAPCTPDQAREGIKPLVRLLEGMSQFWRVSGYVAKIHSMWRDIEGNDPLPSQSLPPPPARPQAHAPPPGAMPTAGPPPQPVPMSAREHWTHTRAAPPPSQSPPYGHISGPSVPPHRYVHPSASSPVPRHPELHSAADPHGVAPRGHLMSSTEPSAYRQMPMAPPPPPRQ